MHQLKFNFSSMYKDGIPLVVSLILKLVNLKRQSIPSAVFAI